MRAAHPACSGLISPRCEQFAKEPLGRRSQELAGDLDPRHLGDDPVGSHDLSLRIAANPRHSVAYQRQGQVEKRRRLYQADAPPQIKINDCRLVRRFLRAMDQVEAERERLPGAAVDPVDRALDGLDREPRRSEDAQHSPPAHRLDYLDRANAIGHRPGHAGESRPVRFAKGWVSQLFQPAGRNEGDEPLQVQGQTLPREDP